MVVCGRSFVCGTYVLWGVRQPQVEQASAQVAWNPGVPPASLVALAQILTLVAGPGAAVKRARGGWLRLEVALCHCRYSTLFCC